MGSYPRQVPDPSPHPLAALQGEAATGVATTGVSTTGDYGGRGVRRQEGHVATPGLGQVGHGAVGGEGFHRGEAHPTSIPSREENCAGWM